VDRRPTAVVGVVGSKLDAPSRRTSWESWRPTVAIGMQDDLEVARLDLLHLPADEWLARQVARDFAQVSPGTRIALHALAVTDPWDLEQVYTALFAFAKTRACDPEQERLLVHVTTGTHVFQICFFLLVEAGYLPGLLLQMRPPEGRGADVAGTSATIDLDLERYDGIARRFEEERGAATSLLKSGIATRNELFNRLIEELELVAERSRDPLLLLGPTGAGKSRLARQVFELKRARQRLEGRFVELNCATLRGDAAASALFGHVRGAFTGAEAAREGLLRAADGGVVFLDEVGELGLDEQAMLLRAIEERVFLPLGSDREVTSDFQLICGTNRELAREVELGRFREDLLARIDLWTFRLPALAERREDLEPNLDYALDQESRARGRKVSFNREARERYLAFALSPAARWTRNFRDLSGSVARMATLAHAARIDRATVEAEIVRLANSWSGAGRAPQGGDRLATLLGPAAAELDLFDRVQLEAVVEVVERSASLSEAGRTLFAASRARRTSVNDADRLRKYLARFGLDFEAVRGAPRA
jgi:transcriptional regulatory protein RtcR